MIDGMFLSPIVYQIIKKTFEQFRVTRTVEVCLGISAIGNVNDDTVASEILRIVIGEGGEKENVAGQDMKGFVLNTDFGNSADSV